MRGWVRAGLAEMIDAPRLYTHERLPQGPRWSEVQQLLDANRGDAAVQIRNYAMLVLLAGYGFDHANATYLLGEGFTLKEIGDHLGHTMVRATEIYAKVDVVSPRRVGEVDLASLVAYERDCAARATPFFNVGSLDALRVVADAHCEACDDCVGLH